MPVKFLVLGGGICFFFFGGGGEVSIYFMGARIFLKKMPSKPSIPWTFQACPCLLWPRPGKKAKTNLERDALGRAPSFGLLFIRLIVPFREEGGVGAPP